MTPPPTPSTELNPLAGTGTGHRGDHDESAPSSQKTEDEADGDHSGIRPISRLRPITESGAGPASPELRVDSPSPETWKLWPSTAMGTPPGGLDVDSLFEDDLAALRMPLEPESLPTLLPTLALTTVVSTAGIAEEFRGTRCPTPRSPFSHTLFLCSLPGRGL